MRSWSRASSTTSWTSRQPLELWQLKRLEGFHRRRVEVAAAYTDAFLDYPALEVPAVRPYVGHAWHLYLLRLRPEALRMSRNKFLEELAVLRIGSSVHFIPIPMHPYYQDRYGRAEDAFLVAADGYHRALSLPLHPGLSEGDVRDVIAAVLSIVEDYAA